MPVYLKILFTVEIGYAKEALGKLNTLWSEPDGLILLYVSISSTSVVTKKSHTSYRFDCTLGTPDMTSGIIAESKSTESASSIMT